MIYTLAVLSAGCALIYGIWYSHRPESALRSLTKTAAIGLLAVIAVVGGGPPYLIAALAISAMGDFAITREGRAYFLAGLSGGTIAHLAYVFLFGSYATEAPMILPVLAILIYAGLTELWLVPHTGDLNGPVRVYVLILAIMEVVALALPAELRLALIGALLLIVSDTLIGLLIFRVGPDSPRFVPLCVSQWTFYFAAQALICMAFIV